MCTEVAGVSVAGPNTVGGVTVGGVSVAGASASRLAFTGSDHVNLYAGVGTALLLAGTALLIATARRRRCEIEIDA